MTHIFTLTLTSSTQVTMSLPYVRDSDFDSDSRIRMYTPFLFLSIHPSLPHSLAQKETNRTEKKNTKYASPIDRQTSLSLTPSSSPDDHTPTPRPCIRPRSSSLIDVVCKPEDGKKRRLLLLLLPGRMRTRMQLHIHIHIHPSVRKTQNRVLLPGGETAVDDWLILRAAVE